MGDPATALREYLATHGGARQRENARAVLPQNAQPCGQVDSLVELFAYGDIAATDVQHVAGETVRDLKGRLPESLWEQAIHPMLLAASQIGASGEAPGNCKRDLLRLVAEDNHLPETTMVPSWAKSPDGSHVGRVQVEIPVLPPHLLLPAIAAHHPEVWQRLVDADRTRRFWENLHPDDPKLREHPMLRKPRWQERAIPLTLHGDSIELTKTKPIVSLTVISLSLMLATEAHSWESKYMLAAFPDLYRLHEQDEAAAPPHSARPTCFSAVSCF